MRALLDGVMLQLRAGLAIENLPNEQLGLFGGDVDGLDSLSVSTIGRHDFVVTAHTGERIDLTLVCFEPGLLPFIERQLRQIGHGGEEPSTARARRVVRGMAQRPDFSGLLEWVTSHPNNAPMYFGA
jgi:hypothetical protein